MRELGCRGFQETDTDLVCYFDTTNWKQQDVARLQHDVTQFLKTLSSNVHIRLRTIEEENWNEQWERTIVPIEVGQRIVVKPSWAHYENSRDKIVVQIDPKMSFGTGYHETTRLMIRLAEKYVSSGQSFLDVGTGTGILAITAVKLGASSSMGIDIDEWSLQNANENVRANGVAEKVTITNQAIDKLGPHQFDVVAANITLNTIIDMLPEMLRRLKQSGLLLLSGLLRDDEQQLLTVLRRQDLESIETVVENEWMALATRRMERTRSLDQPSGG